MPRIRSPTSSASATPRGRKRSRPGLPAWPKRRPCSAVETGGGSDRYDLVTFFRRYKMGTILIIILILLLLGALPSWGYSRNWGYGPSGGLGLVVVIVLILVLMG